MDTPKPDNCPFERYPVPPEMIEQALAIPEEEILAELDEIRRTGGVSFEELIAVFDEVAASDELLPRSGL